MVKKKPGNPNPALPPSRGIPADESLWMPRHYGKDIKEKGGLDKAVIWGAGEVVDFVFPKKYQPTYFKVATDFIDLLLKKERVTKKEISEFLKDTNYSRSTLENKIIPKLVRFGLIKRERELEGTLKKGRSLILSESLTFTNYLERIAFAWNSLVSTARQKRKTTNHP
jgi:predicted transcriptional regulator